MSKSFLKPFSCVGILFIFSEWSGYNAFLNYMIEVLETSGFDLDPRIGPIIVGSIRLFFAGKNYVLDIISCQITTQVQETQEKLVMQITEKFPDFQVDFSWLNTKYPPQISFFLSSNSSQDFHYDGTFQFSWGVFYWVREYRGMLSRMFPNPGGEAGTSLAGSQHNVPALSKLAFFLLASQNTMSGMLAGSLFCRLEHRL